MVVEATVITAAARIPIDPSLPTFRSALRPDGSKNTLDPQLEMSDYVKDLLLKVAARDSHQTEFFQAVSEVMTSLSPILDRHPEYRNASLLERIVDAPTFANGAYDIRWLEQFAETTR